MSEACSLYEQEAFGAFTQGALRPGGLSTTAEALQAAGLAAGASVLDVGCALGTTVAFLAQKGYGACGLDASELLLARARSAHPGLTFTCGDAAALPFAQGRFDAVLCECTLSVLQDAPAALREMNRVLRPGGQVLLSDFNRPCACQEEAKLPFESCVNGAFDRQSLTRLMQDAGFCCILWQDAQDALRQFTAQLIWEYGSFARFWQEMAPGCAVPEAFGKAKFGYAWSIWQKEGDIV